MINKSNIKDLLIHLGFTGKGDKLTKKFKDHDAKLVVDFKSQEIKYPEDKGLKVHSRQTCNFSSNENFVVLECVHRLLEKGYKPQHLELEPAWKLGHTQKSGRADILIRDNEGKALLVIECKTEGNEFKKGWQEIRQDGGQVFSYAQQEGSTSFVSLYASNFEEGRLSHTYHLIALKDNPLLLDEKANEDIPIYEKAKTVKDLHRVWTETYQQDHSTKGIFEEDIPAYEIGKTKFSVKDLEEISPKDIQGKYHRFATILRQHNVSGRENAFDKLVNLFLCKIVDEERNPDELMFYWKGIAYDNSFELQDRLQKLYQMGMGEFLGEEVTYIDNSQIEEAFRFVKDDPDATRDTIKRYFRELKFFTNNDFAFIDVHNQRLFYQNAAVLLEIVRMLQDIRLKTDRNTQHQFLGDMFEGFLDQGVKQSEGQFFTPMPIVKFILASLPLESLVKQEDIPKAIDYACGAGHFLNEYASQMTPYIEQHTKKDPKEYYKAVTGIEKEYRLSKVAKVSAFMYGQNDIQIIYNDALAQNDKVQDGTYSLLVANPPYSVKGFLETLPVSDQQRYSLINSIDDKSYRSSNAIEAFFIERARQLLKPGGVAAIIVPSSLLSKGNQSNTSNKKNLYVATREILLQYFDIVAIAEFGSGTFGKTGTNTVTLFLRRKADDPAPAQHYRNRVTTWFEGKTDPDKVFKDEHLLKKYCVHQDYNWTEYQTLLKGKPSEKIQEHEIFTGYRKDFESWTEVKNLRRRHSKVMKDLPAVLKKEIAATGPKKRTDKEALAELKKQLPTRKKHLEAEQQDELNRKYLAYLRTIESDKLYHFILANQQPNEVVIIKMPNGTADKKKFLGYEWSSAKGNEGIQYLGGRPEALNQLEDAVAEEGEELDKEDERVLGNLLNLDNIKTPLYDPQAGQYHNPEKINSLIRQAYAGETPEIPESLEPFVSTASLTDMLQLDRTDFDKSLSLTPKKTVQLETQWDLVRLKKVATMDYGKPMPEKSRVEGPYPVVGSNGIVGWHNEFLVKSPCIVIGRKGSAGETNWIEKDCFPIDTTFYIKKHSEDVDLYYLHVILEKIDFRKLVGGTGVPGLNRDDAYNQTIPLPPPSVQKQIVKACEKVDKAVDKAREAVEKSQDKIREAINSIYTNTSRSSEIEKLATNVQYGINNKMNTEGVGFKIFRMNEIIDGKMVDDGTMKTVDIPSEEYQKYKLEKGDILFNRTNSIEHVGKTGIFLLGGEYCFASYLVRVQIDIKKAIPEFVCLMMNSDQFQQSAKAVATKAINQSNINATKMKALTIPYPDKKIQEKLVSEVYAEEKKINEARQIIENAPAEKQTIIQKHL